MKTKSILFVILVVLSGCAKEDITPTKHLRQRPNLPLINKVVTDIDGNVYHTVNIGTQTWMLENLKTTHYNNGDPIQNLPNNNDWTTTDSGAWCYYNNDPTNNDEYGKLYNGYVVNDPRGIVPFGWHIPTEDDWNTLIQYLDANADTAEITGMQSLTAGYILQTRTGFNNMSGNRNAYDGNFYNNGIVTYWWSSTPSWSGLWCHSIEVSNGAEIRSDALKQFGFSVRLIKN